MSLCCKYQHIFVNIDYKDMTLLETIKRYFSVKYINSKYIISCSGFPLVLEYLEIYYRYFYLFCQETPYRYVTCC